MFLRLVKKTDYAKAPVTSAKPILPATLEERLEVLAEVGFPLAPEFTALSLLESFDRDHLESSDYDAILFSLGSPEEREPWRPHCRTLWLFDTECIEGAGSYFDIADRMSELAGGAMPLADVVDHVDHEKSRAWLEYTFQNSKKHIDCKVKDDWVDSDIFSHFVEALANGDSDKIFIYGDTGG